MLLIWARDNLFGLIDSVTGQVVFRDTDMKETMKFLIRNCLIPVREVEKAFTEMNEKGHDCAEFGKLGSFVISNKAKDSLALLEG